MNQTPTRIKPCINQARTSTKFIQETKPNKKQIHTRNKTIQELIHTGVNPYMNKVGLMNQTPTRIKPCINQTHARIKPCINQARTRIKPYINQARTSTKSIQELKPCMNQTPTERKVVILKVLHNRDSEDRDVHN